MKYINPFCHESQEIAIKFDKANDKNEIDAMKDIIQEAILLCNHVDEISRAHIYYSIATNFGNLEDKDSDWNIESNTEKQIYYLRKSINIIEKEEYQKKEYKPYVDGLKRVLYTNMGNLLDTLGRKSLALEMYYKAIQIDPDFGMSIGNIGIALSHYAFYMTDKCHSHILHYFAYHYLQYAIKCKNVDKSAMECFKKEISKYSEQYITKMLEPKLNIEQKTYDEKETNYRKWCLINHLFLNPLNDLEVFENSFATDSVQIPNIVTSIDSPQPVIYGLFNQLKQEYIYARFLLYNSQNEYSKVHYVDRDTYLINSFDYPLYSLRIENLKTAFKIAYSLFDRSAFLINEYFDLGIKQKHVSFGSIWNKEYNRGRDKYIYKNVLRPEDNYGLRGLYWIRKDLYEKMFEATEPEAKYLFELRNALEHRYVKVFADWGVDRSDGSVDHLAFYISENKLKISTLKLLKLIRELIICIIVAIRIEEDNRHGKDKENIMPITLFGYSDEWKV